VVPFFLKPVALLQIGTWIIDFCILIYVFFWLIKESEEDWTLRGAASLIYVVPVITLYACVSGLLFCLSSLVLVAEAFYLVFLSCGYNFSEVAFPQYHKTIYTQPYECSGGFHTGGKVYVREDWNIFMRPLLSSEIDVSLSGPAPNSDVLSISGGEIDDNDESLPVTILYNLKTKEIKEIVNP
jgi:hypothetical protein